MKFYLAIVAALSSVVSAANVRKTAEAVSKVKEGEELFGARVQIAGLFHPPTKGELAVLDQVLVEAYNTAHEKVELEMGSSNSKTSVALDDDATMILSEFVAYSGGGYCNLCDDGHDDFVCYLNPACRGLASEVDFFTARSASIHSKFESRICKELRRSGIENFAQASECSFNIVENPGSFSTRLTEKVVYEAQNGHTTDVALSLAGLDKDLSTDEIKALESVVLVAHNEAFAEFGYALTEIDTTSFMFPDNMEGTVFISGAAVPLLQGIYPADRSDVAFAHADFEVAYCDKLKHSDLAVFAGVHDCKFEFVYNPVKELSAKKAALA
eukprot:scaffold7112_cov155-Amphora_coffeaeformis.AAC.4